MMINPVGILFFLIGLVAVVLLLSLTPMMVSLVRKKRTAPVGKPIEVTLQYADGNAIFLGDLVMSKEGKFESGQIELMFAADPQFYQKATGRDALVPKSQIHVRTKDGQLISFHSPFSDLIFLKRQ